MFHKFGQGNKEDRTGYGLLLPLDIVIRRDPLQTRQPDVLFFTNERMKQAGGIGDDEPLEIGPNVAVEVLYERENRQTTSEKLEDYRSLGVNEAWLVYMASETIEVLQLSEAGIQTVAVYVNGQTCYSVAVPGLSVVLADVFE